jgi:hypothetical protein
MPNLSYRPVRGRAPGDQYSNLLDDEFVDTEEAQPEHPMDSAEMRKEHRQILEWWYLEREKQSENRLQMALDADSYDNRQWDPADAEILEERGQMPLVYNEVGPAVDWLIGTERRTRADWKILPRSEDDVDGADVKTKTLKYISDVNRAPFARSRAFGDTVKVGVGWVDDGVQDDPTQEVLYSKYEDWRNVLHDSAGYELDLSDGRYLFRWRWVDEDIALAMFPGRETAIKAAIEDASAYDSEHEDDPWYLGEPLSERRTGVVRATGTGVSVDARRRRIKLIECQYRKPLQVPVVTSGPWKGTILPEGFQQEYETVPRVMMRVHFSVLTEAAMISWAPSALRHNRFTLTPIWCYRRGRDRLPYGVIRRVRDIQQDINKRASKAQWLSNTNQLIGEEGAVADWDVTREEANRPDGVIVTRPGKTVEIRRDAASAAAQIDLMTLGSQTIQKAIGINNENLGRQTNAISGAAIEARQDQGAVGTTEPFDNLRFAIQVQGEKQLSLAEQFMTEEKVIRLTGAKGKIDWLRINQPEMQPDGSVRYINDVTASRADFVVSEQDYSGTLRQVMFENLNNLAARLPPDVALRVLTIGMEFSDLPNKDEIVEAFRKMTGDRDESQAMTPEEEAAQQEQAAAQQEQIQAQKDQIMLALQEQQAKVREINARAEKLEAENAAGGAGLANQVRSQTSDQIDAMAEQLRQAQAELANRTMQIQRDADVRIEVARIDAESRERIAEIQQVSDDKLQAIEEKMKKIASAGKPAPKAKTE